MVARGDPAGRGERRPRHEHRPLPHLSGPRGPLATGTSTSSPPFWASRASRYRTIA
jgi:hypothetical protein